MKPFFIVINRCKLGKNAGKRKQQDIQMKLNIIFDFLSCFLHIINAIIID